VETPDSGQSIVFADTPPRQVETPDVTIPMQLLNTSSHLEKNLKSLRAEEKRRGYDIMFFIVQSDGNI
jgi:hypothetical protein